MNEQEIVELEKYVHFEQGPMESEYIVDEYAIREQSDRSIRDEDDDEDEDDGEEDDDDDMYNTPIRPRKRFSSSQVDILEKTYNENDHPSRDTKERLASSFATSPRRIQIWFQNRRAKSKRGTSNSNCGDEQKISPKITENIPSNNSSNIYLINHRNNYSRKRKDSESSVEDSLKSQKQRFNTCFHLPRTHSPNAEGGDKVTNSDKSNKLECDLPDYSMNINMLSQELLSSNMLHQSPSSRSQHECNYRLLGPVLSHESYEEHYVDPMATVQENEKNSEKF